MQCQDLIACLVSTLHYRCSSSSMLTRPNDQTSMFGCMPASVCPPGRETINYKFHTIKASYFTHWPNLLVTISSASSLVRRYARHSTNLQCPQTTTQSISWLDKHWRWTSYLAELYNFYGYTRYYSCNVWQNVTVFTQIRSFTMISAPVGVIRDDVTRAYLCLHNIGHCTRKAGTFTEANHCHCLFKWTIKLYELFSYLMSVTVELKTRIYWDSTWS